MPSTDISKPQKLLNPGSLDAWWGPYASVAAACAAIPNEAKNVDGEMTNFRQGKTVGIITDDGVKDYHWPKIFTDAGLVKKTDLEPYLKSENFPSAMTAELNDRITIQTFGINETVADLNATLGAIFCWTSPQAVNSLEGFVEVITFQLGSAGKVRFAIGSASAASGAFTAREMLPEFNGVVGVNTYILNTPVAIHVGEILAIYGGTTAGAKLAQKNGAGAAVYNSTWVRQTATNFTDTAPGWFVYTYSVRRVLRSSLYNVFKTITEADLAYLKKTGFRSAVNNELLVVRSTYSQGIYDAGTAGSTLESTRYLWTSPQSIATVKGVIKIIKFFLITAGKISFTIGSASATSGGFTARKLIGEVDGVVGENILTLATPEEINIGEIVAAHGGTVVGGQLAINNGSVAYASKWVRQTASTFTDTANGWFRVFYTIEEAVASKLYETFETVEQGNLKLNKSDFSKTISEEISRVPVYTIKEFGNLSEGTGNIGPGSIDRVAYNRSGCVADRSGRVNSFNANIYQTGNIYLSIGTDKGTFFSVRKRLGPFNVSVGLNRIEISELISVGEAIAVSGGTCRLKFGGGGGSTLNRFVQISTTDINPPAPAMGGFGTFYSYGFDIDITEVKPLDKTYLGLSKFDDAITSYVSTNVIGSDQTLGFGMGVTDYLAAISTAGYIGNKKAFPAEGIVKTLNIICQASGTLIFAIGNIDQYNIFLEEKVFTRSVTAGINNLTNINVAVKEGQVCLIKAPFTIGLGFNAVASSSYVSGASGTGLVTTNGQNISYELVFNSVKKPSTISRGEYDKLKAETDALKVVKSPIVLSVPGNFIYKLICNDDGSNLRAVPAYPGKIVCIGNSITLHAITTYWWGNWGMAASKRELDYAHVLHTMIKAKNPAATLSAKNDAGWERAPNTFNYTTNWNPLIPVDTEFVVIRLGDNVINYVDYQQKCLDMLLYVKSRVPNAVICTTGNWYASDERDLAMKNAAAIAKVPYIPIVELNTAENRSALGTQVYGDDGQWHTVELGGVATHPGDKGMQAIAEKIFNSLF